MHLKHMYESRYLEVVQAFVQKYSQPSSYVYTTICHVEMIDNDKFQFVRRIENIMSSTPLYEKIIIDRKTNEVHGYTFESPKDETYSEHYIY